MTDLPEMQPSALTRLRAYRDGQQSRQPEIDALRAKLEARENDDPCPWEGGVGGPGHRWRDLELEPYDRQERRAAKWLFDHTEAGGGDDPVGFLCVALGWAGAKEKALRAALDEAERALSDLAGNLDSINRRERSALNDVEAALARIREVKRDG